MVWPIYRYIEANKMDMKYKWINRVSVDKDEVHVSFSYSDGLGGDWLDMFKFQLKQIYDEVFKE